jgi:RNA polymerase-binding protein DksA
MSGSRERGEIELSRKIKHKIKSHREPAKIKARSLNAGRKKFNKKELADFKKIILVRKDEIMDEIKHISDDTLKKSQKEAAGDISGYTYHMADVATDTYDREFSLGLASNERELLYELDDALKKIDEGAFGICEECKSLITKTRLKAVPYARLCVKCQQRKEKR